MRGDIGQLFEIDGGDGDQEFFGKKIMARRVHAEWFPERLPRGKAFLLKVESGAATGSFIAFTSRTTSSLEDQIASENWISVVVHKIENPGPGFPPKLEAARAVGMAVVRVI
jgi:precorrin-6x reductase